MSGPTVWVVSGEVGEYSDRSWWVVRAFATKADADAFVAQLDAVIDAAWFPKNERGERRARFDRYDDESEVTRAMLAPIKALDPNFASYCDGPTTYYATELPMGAPLLASVEVTA